MGEKAGKQQDLDATEPKRTDWSPVVDAWTSHPEITPRQAAALVCELNWFADMHLGEWLNHPNDPLYDVPPFVDIDRRALFAVWNNMPWVAEARDRCWAVAEEIMKGQLPHESNACFFDELVVLAACNMASEGFADMVGDGVFDEIPARSGVNAEVDPDNATTGDEDWDLLSDWLIDSSKWDAHRVLGPIGMGSPLVAAALAEHHPFNWFDRR